MSATKATATTKKVWISIPIVTNEPTNTAAVDFLENGRKDLEVKTAAFIAQYLFDNCTKFSVDFESTKIQKESVLASIPRRIQRLIGFKPKKEVVNLGTEKNECFVELPENDDQGNATSPDPEGWGAPYADHRKKEECTSDNDPFLASLPI